MYATWDRGKRKSVGFEKHTFVEIKLEYESLFLLINQSHVVFSYYSHGY